MAGVDIRTVQELMGHSTITMTMRYAHLSPDHLRKAVNKASLSSSVAAKAFETVSKTVSAEGESSESIDYHVEEDREMLEKDYGGAERVRTAASQFCRLLP